jgi:hypothetical protein
VVDAVLPDAADPIGPPDPVASVLDAMSLPWTDLAGEDPCSVEATLTSLGAVCVDWPVTDFADALAIAEPLADEGTQTGVGCAVDTGEVDPTLAPVCADEADVKYGTATVKNLKIENNTKSAFAINPLKPESAKAAETAPSVKRKTDQGTEIQGAPEEMTQLPNYLEIPSNGSAQVKGIDVILVIKMENGKRIVGPIVPYSMVGVKREEVVVSVKVDNATQTLIITFNDAPKK